MRLYLILLLFSTIGICQELPKGSRILEFDYKGDPVEIFIISESGEEYLKKPLLVFLQGSLARPIGLKSENGYQPFLPPFRNDSLRKKYHTLVFSKAFIPPFVNPEDLNDQHIYLDENGNIPKNFLTRDYLEYYVNRNNYVLDQLLKEDWIDSTKIILSGHSQGSSVGAFMADKNNSVTHLIYASGNPYGRILSTLGQVRDVEDTLNYTFETFQKFKEVVLNPSDDFNENGGDSNKSIYSFNQNANQILLSLKIPTLVVYGSKDKNTPYIDLLHIESIKSNNQYLDFKEYTGTEHNFFPVDKQGNIDYSVNSWERIAEDWYNWIEKN